MKQMVLLFLLHPYVIMSAGSPSKKVKNKVNTVVVRAVPVDTDIEQLSQVEADSCCSQSLKSLQHCVGCMNTCCCRPIRDGSCSALPCSLTCLLSRSC